MENHYFGIVDFVLFFGLLLCSTLIGVYSACKRKKQETTESYYFGNRKMSPIPLGLSLSVSFISAVTVIGAPVESYLFGAVIAWINVGSIVAAIFACCYFVPLVYRLNITSIYEYLEMRFDRRVRILCSAITLVQMIAYMGVCVYIPALALNTVTPLEMKWTIILTSFVCTFYTTLGGFKAVVWTDTLQATIMFLGSVVLCVQGTVLVGGPSNVWDAAIRGGRMNMLKISFDPTVRASAIHYIIGNSVMSAAMACSNQAIAQRVMSCQSPSTAKRALLFSLLPTVLIAALAVANGVVMYAYYENCDPLLSHQIEKHDQMIPNMMTDAFRNTPGLAGIFVAAACSGTLSTVSTGINSLSVIVTEDLVGHFKKSLTTRQKLWGGKICGALIGCLVTVIAFVAGYLGKTVIQIAASLLGAFAGPIFGAFISGMFIPKVNGKGAFVGVLLSCVLCLWMIIGSAIYGVRPEKLQMLSISSSNCSDDIQQTLHNSSVAHLTSALLTTPASDVHDVRPPIADYFYSVSYIYVCLFGVLVSVFTGLLTSLVTGPNDSSQMNPALFVPLIESKRLPQKLRVLFRCGVPEIQEKCNGHELKGLNCNGAKQLDSPPDIHPDAEILCMKSPD